MPLKKLGRHFNLIAILAVLSLLAVTAYYLYTHVPAVQNPVSSLFGGCPDGGQITGAVPPDGTERGCVVQDQAGNNVRHGSWKEWYLNGAPHKEGVYAQGRRTGMWTWWYPNGKKMQEGKFWDGAPSGKWSFWDQDGQPSAKPPKDETEAHSADVDDLSRKMKKSF